MKLTIGPNEIMKGWGTDFSTSNNIGIEAGQGKYSKSTAINPFTYGRIGQIAAGEAYSNIADGSERVTALPLNGVVNSFGTALIILENGTVVTVASDAVQATQRVTAVAGTTVHTGHTGSSPDIGGEDILVYKNATNEYVLYSWNDDTDGDIGRMLYDTSSPDDDWWSDAATSGEVLTKGVAHKMCIGPDGNVYVTNGQYIAKLDITTSTVTMAALNLGTGFIATDIKTFRNQLVIVGYKATTFISGFSNSESRAWFWDTTSPFHNQMFNLQDNYVSAILAHDNLYVFTNGRSQTTKVKFFNGNGFETIFESAQIGSYPKPGSVDIFQNMVHYAPNGGSQIFCLDGKSFHYRSTLSSATDIGMVKNLYLNVLYVGKRVSSTYTIEKLTYDTYVVDAKFLDSIRSLPYKSTVKKIIVYFSQFGSGASLLISMFRNYATAFTGESGADDLLTTASPSQTINSTNFPNIATDLTAELTVGNGFNLNTFVMMLKFNHASVSNTAAIVRKVEIYYDTPQKVDN